MTVSRIWLLALLVAVAISVSINAIVLTSLTDRYFKDYMTENYQEHVEQIIDYSQKALLEDELSYKQMAIELETHLVDPIIHIKLYNPAGELLVDVYDDYHITGMMSQGWMMRNMMSPLKDEIEQYMIEDSANSIGILNITRYSSVENSMISQRFKSRLLLNSLYAMIIAILISIFLARFISKKMSKALIDTANMAQEIHLGEMTLPNGTGITEINTIRESLKSLQERLRLKQTSRKELIDELVHQSRTPLTVLKSHLEAIEDGMIKVTSEEIIIWQNQIDNLVAIISNMSNMLDADRDILEVQLQMFEFSQLIKQIITGLQNQFDKKDISLESLSNIKVPMVTDKYLLSQAIYNVLTNAYKYTNQKGHVQVKYNIQKETLILEIKDSGIGIDQNEVIKIFDAYYRCDTAVKSQGDGIGLYIARENLKLINGDINVESEKGIGSVFIIKVPINLKKGVEDVLEIKK